MSETIDKFLNKIGYDSLREYHERFDRARRHKLGQLYDATSGDIPTRDGSFEEAVAGEGEIHYSVRTKPAPKKTGIGYKVFYRGKDGKFYPPMVANPGGKDTLELQDRYDMTLTKTHKTLQNGLKEIGLQEEQIISFVVSLMDNEQGMQELIDYMANEKSTAHEVIKKLEEIDNGVYLNDFHREWNERCMKENARVQSMRFSHAFLKAQSDRMNELVRMEEEKARAERKRNGRR